MRQTLIRVALGAALVVPLAACGQKEPVAPASVVPDVPAVDPAEEARLAKEAAYRKHYDAGTKALAAADADAAVTHMKSAIGEKSDTADAHFLLARGYVLKKNDAEALKMFDQAIRIHPQYADAFMERAALHERANRLNDASYDYRQVIAIEPDAKTLARAYWLRGAVMDRLGKRDDYRFDRERAILWDPEYQKQLNAGDVRVFNHTGTKLKIEFERFVNPDGTLRKFPAGYQYEIPDDTTRFLHDDKDRTMPASSVRYTITTGVGSKTFEQTYEKGMALEIHITQPDLPRK